MCIGTRKDYVNSIRERESDRERAIERERKRERERDEEREKEREIEWRRRDKYLKFISLWHSKIQSYLLFSHNKKLFNSGQREIRGARLEDSLPSSLRGSGSFEKKNQANF